MKVYGQEMKVTLLVHGREKTFSEKELIAITEKHFPNEVTEQASTAKMSKVPTENQWFEVDPLGIDLKLFRKKRKDASQETTRKLILEAFAELWRNPRKYGRKFKTMMPKKDWSHKTGKQFSEMGCKLGNHMADWVEQAMEWAQRIANGESWEDVCNKADTANCYRAIIWKNGSIRIVGGSHYSDLCCSASDVHNNDYDYDFIFINTVPLVVLEVN